MLIDAFTYFNEKELVELRLKYLNSIVDYFVVIESNITFTGKKKKWNFPDVLKNNLKEFAHKIQYHQLNIKLEEIKNEESWIIDNIKGDDFWRIENFQRNYIKTACKKFANDDILIISDLDEIPSKDKLSFIKSCNFRVIAPVAFEQASFHLDCNFLELEKWVGSVVATKELIDKYGPQIFRDLRKRISRFTDAGWSFSSFGGIKKVREKIESFCHEEYNKEEYKNEAHLERCIKTGSDLFGRKVKKRKVDKNFFPEDLLKLMKENSTFYFGSKTTI